MIEPVEAQEYVSRPERRTPEQFEYIKMRIDGSVARLTLNRPDHNLLNEAFLRELSDGITFAGQSPEVKLVVLDSACKVFCGGIDIGEYTSERVFQMLDAFHGAFTGMIDVGKPVICVVNGPAIGGSWPQPSAAGGLAAQAALDGLDDCRAELGGADDRVD